MNKILKNFTLMLVISLYFTPIVRAAIISPFNGKELRENNNNDSFSFILAGHIYGSPSNKSVFPASTILSSVDFINSSGSSFFISLGDNYREPSHIPYFKNFISKFKIPFFNSEGNHDVIDRKLYEKNFKKSYYDFIFLKNLFIILSSELNEGEISGAQLKYFKKTISAAKKSQEIKNIFILTHKLIWSLNNEDFKVVFNNVNANYDYAYSDNFLDDIKPVIIEISKNKPIYLISGDIGAREKSPGIFYQKDKTENITYIATGIGDTKRDSILIVDVNNKKEDVIFKAISLTTKEITPILNYGTNYWKEHYNYINENKYDLQFYKSKIKYFIFKLQRPYTFFSGFIIGILFIWCIIKVKNKTST